MRPVDSEPHPADREPGRALFVELLGGIGDLIFALPAIDALSWAHPNLRWDVLTFAPGSELLHANPRVSRVFIARKGHPKVDPAATGSATQPFCWHDLSARLQDQRYEMIVTDTRHSGLPELIEASGAPWVITQLWRGAGPEEPIARLFLRRLREEGAIDPRLPDPPARVFLWPSEHDHARETWKRLDLLCERTVILNPHAGMAIKRWPRESFIQLGQALQHEGWAVAVLTGEDSKLAQDIAGPLEAMMLPLLSLRETAACLAGAALVVSADSGLAHLANAVGTPVLGIYGPTWAGRYGVPPPGRNLQSPFDCPERRPMNFTLQRCWYTGRCIFREKRNCCEDVTVSSALTVAREILQPNQPAIKRDSLPPLAPPATDRGPEGGVSDGGRHHA